MTLHNPAVIRVVSKAHAFLYRLFGGAGVTGHYGRAPILLLMTTGRKTGKVRTAPLIYQRDGCAVIVIASNAGARREPLWRKNLQASPRARLQMGRNIHDVLAAEASGAEKQRLWLKMTGVYRNFDDYQARTSRIIPLIVLTPLDLETVRTAEASGVGRS